MEHEYLLYLNILLTQWNFSKYKNIFFNIKNHTLFTADIPTTDNILIGIYADDTAILSYSQAK